MATFKEIIVWQHSKKYLYGNIQRNTCMATFKEIIIVLQKVQNQKELCIDHADCPFMWFQTILKHRGCQRI